MQTTPREPSGASYAAAEALLVEVCTLAAKRERRERDRAAWEAQDRELSRIMAVLGIFTVAVLVIVMLGPS